MTRAAFTTIRTEGGLLPSDLLSRVAALDSQLEAIGPEAYHLAPNERHGEAVTRAWGRLRAAWPAFRQALDALPPGDPATSATRSKWLLVLFQELGYGQLQTARAVELDGKSYAISHSWGMVPIHLVGAGIDLERRTPGTAGASASSPHGLLQELLNRSDDRLWGFGSNGLRLRLLRDNAALTRQAFVEFDLEAMFDGEVYADFAVLWLVCHQSRVEGDVPEKCVLERWMADAIDRGTRALDQLRAGVEACIEQLGSGFLSHPANAPLRERLREGALSDEEYQRQLLRLVYRLLFLLVAESRDALLRPDADATAAARYRQYYSVTRLRALADARRGGPHPDQWRSLRTVFAGLGHTGIDALGLPALGSFLWSAAASPDLDGADLANRDLLAAIRSLGSVQEGNLRRSVDYRNLGAEELGSIYESLLELHPALDLDARQFALATAAGHERKTTGSYYTPTSLVSQLLDTALDPVLDDAARASDPEAAILALTVLDPACGSGHFLIAAGHRIARRLAAARTGDDEPSPTELLRALRDVVGHCLFGIDVNPMAVELCKVSLWMEAIEPGKPLSFLDHHVVCGNALLGTTPRLLENGLPDTAFKALPGDDRVVATAWKKANKQERIHANQAALDLHGNVSDVLGPLAAALDALERSADDSVADLEEKQRQWEALVASDAAERTRLAADAWCAAFMAHKTIGAPVITDRVVRQLAEDPSMVPVPVRDAIRGIAEDFRFLHLHVTFPQVFRIPKDDKPDRGQEGWSGGFSVVLGNPPWDQIQYDPRESFAATHPEISMAATTSIRDRMIADLEVTDPAAHSRHLRAVRRNEAIQAFLHGTSRYPLGAVGRLNTAPLFLEYCLGNTALTGRTGLVLPSGLATDSFTQGLFRSLISSSRLDSFYDFINDSGLFPGVGHGRQKFALVTVAGDSQLSNPDFACFLQNRADLQDADRHFELSQADLAAVNPNTGTLPIFRSRRDARLTLRAHKLFPIVARDDGANDSGWTFKYRLMVMTNTDADLLEGIARPGTLPLMKRRCCTSSRTGGAITLSAPLAAETLNFLGPVSRS